MPKISNPKIYLAFKGSWQLPKSKHFGHSWDLVLSHVVSELGCKRRKLWAQPTACKQRSNTKENWGRTAAPSKQCCPTQKWINPDMKCNVGSEKLMLLLYNLQHSSSFCRPSANTVFKNPYFTLWRQTWICYDLAASESALCKNSSHFQIDVKGLTDPSAESVSQIPKWTNLKAIFIRHRKSFSRH